jgi:hypothetical protein
MGNDGGRPHQVDKSFASIWERIVEWEPAEGYKIAWWVRLLTAFWLVLLVDCGCLGHKPLLVLGKARF